MILIAPSDAQGGDITGQSLLPALERNGSAIIRSIVESGPFSVLRAALQTTSEVDVMTTGAVPSAVFGTVALAFGNLPAAARWREVYAKLGDVSPSRCGEQCTQRARALDRAVATARDERFISKLRMVNVAVNRMIGYASDRDVYGRMDHWAAPAEIVSVGRGDCEDYAILKMAALRAAGIPARSMSLVVLRDRERDLFHAVLAVTTNQGHFILDNVHDAVLPDTRISRYQPLYSLSQDRSWIHGSRRTDPEIASRPVSFRNVMPGVGPDALNTNELMPPPSARR